MARPFWDDADAPSWAETVSLSAQAHGMLPHLGAGAGQGLEDALLLVRLLTRPETNLDNMEVRQGDVMIEPGTDQMQAVLHAYSEVRMPRSQTVWDASHRAGSIYDNHGPSGPTFEGMRRDLQDLWKPVWGYDIDDDVKAAVALL